MPEYAFPGLNAQFTGLSSDGDERYEIAPSGGMLLRDHFAGLAMQGLLARAFTKDEKDRPFVEWVAEFSYEIADEMLRAREKEPPCQP
ncbi:hypothetical protein DelCs14_2662 [Delftia sp. Cs1-4]|uniref:hypothetical protein n=1 Tax=Delftia sp. (strain Cs1-4) TaxID=742013 RepID=UPI00020E8274|nr:hypothetical protein [Delftia sp. Cs1-4]AEF89674.1 hypothetical protein DelCs14_2662 [Delftia sp. Cs1-4]